MLCVTWDDDFRTVKTVNSIPSVASNREQFEAFQRFFEAKLLVFRADETERFTAVLSIFPGKLIRTLRSRH